MDINQDRNELNLGKFLYKFDDYYYTILVYWSVELIVVSISNFYKKNKDQFSFSQLEFFRKIRY